MNWLAHIFLSEPHIEFQHGNLLADLLKGRSWPGAGARFEAGLAMHRAIDRFTDAHPLVRRSKSRLGESGYLRGAVIDIAYDHLLVTNWSRFAKPTCAGFIDTFHDQSRCVSRHYPDAARHFLARLVKTGHLHDYATFSGIERALWRIERRLSSRVLARERPLGYLSVVESEIRRIELDFLEFMPQLIHHFRSMSGVETDDHWLR